MHDVCRRHNVLLIADEVQTGLCRAGTNLACDHDGVRPDILVSCLESRPPPLSLPARPLQTVVLVFGERIRLSR